MAVILIVEDERLLLWSLVKRLESLGHTVRQAASLSEASTELRRDRPDLVILDLSLPDGHGLDLLERNPDLPFGTPVLVITAVGESGDQTRANRLGVAEFLTKPVSHDALARLVAQHLERHVSAPS
jgi:DNA-binding NtrC family response regulator